MSQSTLHLGVVMDPISDIAYKKDTTLAMLWAAQERGYTLHYMEQDDLFLQAGKAYARMRPLTVHRNPEHWYDLGEAIHRIGDDQRLHRLAACEYWVEDFYRLAVDADAPLALLD